MEVWLSKITAWQHFIIEGLQAVTYHSISTNLNCAEEKYMPIRVKLPTSRTFDCNGTFWLEINLRNWSKFSKILKAAVNFDKDVQQWKSDEVSVARQAELARRWFADVCSERSQSASRPGSHLTRRGRVWGKWELKEIKCVVTGTPERSTGKISLPASTQHLALLEDKHRKALTAVSRPWAMTWSDDSGWWPRLMTAVDDSGWWLRLMTAADDWLMTLAKGFREGEETQGP